LLYHTHYFWSPEKIIKNTSEVQTSLHSSVTGWEVYRLLCLTTNCTPPRVFSCQPCVFDDVTSRLLAVAHEYIIVSSPNGETNRSWPRRELSRLKNSSFPAERFKRTLKCIITYWGTITRQVVENKIKIGNRRDRLVSHSIRRPRVYNI